MQVADLRLEERYINREPFAVAAVELANIRTLLAVPMLKEDCLVEGLLDEVMRTRHAAQISDLTAAAPIKRKKTEPFAIVQLARAATAFSAINRLKATVWLSLEHRRARANVARSPCRMVRWRNSVWS